MDGSSIFELFKKLSEDEFIITEADLTSPFENNHYAHPAEILNLNYYIQQRVDEREVDIKSGKRKWPKDLSNREMILCKLNMISDALYHASVHHERFNRDTTHIELLRKYIYHVRKEALINPPLEPGQLFPKFKGIPKEDADFISKLYLILKKSYKIV